MHCDAVRSRGRLGEPTEDGEGQRFGPDRGRRAFFVQVAFGLGNIHVAGFLHHDVKPANVFFTGRGVVKVGDLGLAKVIEAALGGTTAYMAPEVLFEEPYDARYDAWSLGVVLYTDDGTEYAI